MFLIDRVRAEKLYNKFNNPAFIVPDPLQCVLDEPATANSMVNREVIAFIAASCAVGRAGNIVKFLRQFRTRLPEDLQMLKNISDSGIEEICAPLRYRFYGPSQLANILRAIRTCLSKHGTFEAFFAYCLHQSDNDLLTALREVCRSFHDWGNHDLGNMLPGPDSKGTFKRLLLFLRWMVRRDSVDPGGWGLIEPSALFYPVDLHLARIAQFLGLSNRKAADWRMVEDVTAFFREINPQDPVKYDFAITRCGIHPKLSYENLTEIFS